MTSGNQWREEQRRRRMGWTELNEATEAAYRACRRKHVPSGETVMRFFAGGPRALPICANCGVPYGAPSTGSSKRGGQNGGGRR